MLTYCEWIRLSLGFGHNHWGSILCGVWPRFWDLIRFKFEANCYTFYLCLRICIYNRISFRFFTISLNVFAVCKVVVLLCIFFVSTLVFTLALGVCDIWKICCWPEAKSKRLVKCREHQSQPGTTLQFTTDGDDDDDLPWGFFCFILQKHKCISPKIVTTTNTSLYLLVGSYFLIYVTG